MPTPAERRALLFVATVAALGIGVRGCRAVSRPEAPLDDREALARQIAAVDSVVASGGRRRPTAKRGAPAASVATSQSVGLPPPRSRASAPATTSSTPLSVDLDRASAEELDRLPGIGPALAARIVADRELNGGFGSVEGLQRVRGIGPALAARLVPFVTFSAPMRPP